MSNPGLIAMQRANRRRKAGNALRMQSSRARQKRATSVTARKNHATLCICFEGSESHQLAKQALDNLRLNLNGKWDSYILGPDQYSAQVKSLSIR